MQHVHFFRSILFRVAGSLLLLSSVAQAETPDKPGLLALLKERNFQELDRTLRGYQSRHEQGTELDETVRRAFRSFANSDPKLETLLNEWIAAHPSSYAAYVSRGTYFRHLGSLARGCRSCSQTHADQFRGMRQQFASATADLEKALSLNPKLTIVYRQLMSMAMSKGDRKQLLQYRDQGLAIDPASFVIREKYIFSLQPKWGGSMEEMEAFLQETRRHYAKNSHLKVLEGYPSLTQADMLKRRDLAAAMQSYDKAIELGEHWWFYYERGCRFYWTNQYAPAIADLSRALELYPQHPQLLEKRGWAHYYLRQVDKAFADFNLARQLDALEPRALHGRGNVYWVQGRYQDAAEDFQQALIFGKHKASIWRSLGQLQFDQFQNYQEAAEAYKVALQLKPSDRKTAEAYKRALELIPSDRETWGDFFSAWYGRFKATVFGL